MRRRFLLTGFILLHALGMLCWALPLDLYPLEAIKKIIHPYFSLCGLDQTWNMFSPDPLVANSYTIAEIEFQNGATSVWKFPRMEQLGLLDRYKKERYRKFTNDWLWREKHFALWPDAARFIAREARTPFSRPQTIRLIRYSVVIPEPGSQVKAPRWKKHIFFTYPVEEADLR